MIDKGLRMCYNKSVRLIGANTKGYGGTEMQITVAARYHRAYPGGSYSRSACVDFLAEAGFDGMDVSLEEIGSLEDAWESVLYAMASRAHTRGLSMPTCHLPFAMPSPDCSAAMETFARDLCKGVRGAHLMGIPTCVMHPIARHVREAAPEHMQAWLSENERFLAPVVELACRLGVYPLIENMANLRESANDHLLGSTAAEVRLLSQVLGAGVCWDFGHAHLTGLQSASELTALVGCVHMIHVHDSDGTRDAHDIPFEGTIDWKGAMTALHATGYNGPLNLELKGSHLSPDFSARSAHAERAVQAGKRLSAMFDSKNFEKNKS